MSELKLEALRVEMHDYIERLANSYRMNLRIIVDKMPPLPMYYEMVGWDPDTELSTVRWKDHPGWGKPDVEFKGVEIRYLCKQFRP